MWSKDNPICMCQQSLSQRCHLPRCRRFLQMRLSSREKRRVLWNLDPSYLWRRTMPRRWNMHQNRPRIQVQLSKGLLWCPLQQKNGNWRQKLQTDWCCQQHSRVNEFDSTTFDYCHVHFEISAIILMIWPLYYVYWTIHWWIFMMSILGLWMSCHPHLILTYCTVALACTCYDHINTIK